MEKLGFFTNPTVPIVILWAAAILMLRITAIDEGNWLVLEFVMLFLWLLVSPIGLIALTLMEESVQRVITLNYLAVSASWLMGSVAWKLCRRRSPHSRMHKILMMLLNIYMGVIVIAILIGFFALIYYLEGFVGIVGVLAGLSFVVLFLVGLDHLTNWLAQISQKYNL